MELLQQLMEIYKKKHARDWQSWFNKMAQDLIETHDISKKDYIKFCAENDIFIKDVKEKPAKKSSSSDTSGSSWGCGSGGSNTVRGGC